ncbi:MAG: DUF6364 family protein [Syntrophobacteraceae bacterium]
MGQNITLNLDKEIIQKAKILAARRQTSVSRLLGEELERVVGEAERFEQAKGRAIAQMRKGWHLGGKAAASREDLHER